MYKPIQYLDTSKISPGIKYREFLPSPALAGYVSCYWAVNTTGGVSTAPYRVLPDGCIDVICDLIGKSSFISGIANKTEYIPITGGISYLGIRFLPNTIPFILRGESSIGLNANFEMDRGFAELREMTDEIFNERGGGSLISIIENHLSLLFRDFAINRRFEALLNHILGVGGASSVHELADYHGISEKQIGRCFHENIGMSTKSFLRIVRFQNAFRNFKDRKHSDAVRAIEAGYYDQSHLIKDMNHFLGSMKNIY